MVTAIRWDCVVKEIPGSPETAISKAGFSPYAKQASSCAEDTMRSLNRFALLGVLALGPGWASTITPVSGSITLTGVVDPSLNFLAVDIRGTAGFVINALPVILTDAFAPASFGNLMLVAENVPFDGSGVAVNFDPTTITIVPGPGLDIGTTGTTIVGTPTAGNGIFLSPAVFSFELVSVAPFDGTPDFVDTFTLTQATVGSVPEPATFGLLAGAFGGLLLMSKRRASTRL